VLGPEAAAGGAAACSPAAAGVGVAAGGLSGVGTGGGHVGGPQLQQLHAACQTAIKQELNPLFKVHRVVQVDSLPRTASNKVMRRMLKSPAAPAASKM
jgi:acetyl-CoA synthetase